MKKAIFTLSVIFLSFTSQATIHIVDVWDGYFQFISQDITIQLGDTVQWLPLDVPTMIHTITSTNIPAGAEAFDQIWQAPADTFFQYIPQIAGLYEYECTPHAESYGMIGSINVLGVVSGVSDVESFENDLHVYPNPTVDFIQFNKSNFVYPFKIFTPKGELVLAGTTNDIINVSTLANGLYHIQIVGKKPRNLSFIKH